jgi:hypothetical protein
MAGNKTTAIYGDLSTGDGGTINVGSDVYTHFHQTAQRTQPFAVDSDELAASRARSAELPSYRVPERGALPPLSRFDRRPNAALDRPRGGPARGGARAPKKVQTANSPAEVAPCGQPYSPPRSTSPVCASRRPIAVIRQWDKDGAREATSRHLRVVCALAAGQLSQDPPYNFPIQRILRV